MDISEYRKSNDQVSSSNLTPPQKGLSSYPFNINKAFETSNNKDVITNEKPNPGSSKNVIEKETKNDEVELKTLLTNNKKEQFTQIENHTDDEYMQDTQKSPTLIINNQQLRKQMT